LYCYDEVGKIHFDAKAGRGDAGGDKDFVSEHSPGVVVAVCRFVDHKRVPYACRDDLVTHATLTCMDVSLNCVRWSSDTVLLWGSCNDPDVDGRGLSVLTIVHVFKPHLSCFNLFTTTLYHSLQFLSLAYNRPLL
jgi:hypothetical protein